MENQLLGRSEDKMHKTAKILSCLKTSSLADLFLYMDVNLFHAAFYIDLREIYNNYYAYKYFYQNLPLCTVFQIDKIHY